MAHMKKRFSLSGLGSALKKYKYPVLVLALGVGLLLLPKGTRTAAPQATEPTAPGETLEQRLEALLSQIDGAGRVKVMLTAKEGARTVYQSDSDSESGGTADRDRSSTVILNRGGSTQEAVVQQVLPPVYLGAVVVCQGADSAAVRLAVTQAVSDLTGLGADHISVVKMKSF